MSWVRDETQVERAAGGWTLLLTLSVLAAAVALGVLVLLVRSRWTPLGNLDRGVSERAVAVVRGSDLLLLVTQRVTDLGDPLVVVLVLLTLAAILAAVQGRPRAGLLVAVAGLGGQLLSDTAKDLVGRARPVLEVPLATESSLAFPSGHAMGSLTLCLVLLLVGLPGRGQRVRHGLVGLAVVYVLAVGVSRVALGVHYPTDVLGGWLLAAVWVAGLARIGEVWRDERRVAVSP